MTHQIKHTAKVIYLGIVDSFSVRWQAEVGQITCGLYLILVH